MGVSQSSPSDPGASESETSIDPAEPIRQVRAILLHLGLPAELVLDIMELAEYYAIVKAERTDGVTLRADQHTHMDHCSALLYLVTPPLPDCKEGESAKKVVWVIEGHDQGWGGQHPGTFHGAYSWYEACIFRSRPGETDSDSAADAEFLDTHNLYRKPEDVREEIHWDLVPNGDSFVWRVQGNRVAAREFEQHVIEWRAGEQMDAAEAEEHGHGTGVGFVEALRPGDRVGLWMRAMYGGWRNTIAGATVFLMYDVR
ncbi:hypothetical protein L227DRAFT_649307 [Lentinus tigrinus ALCF2SS1-6]|uniref:Uncharacterized protein n=1 Tax=Lentinus tigrinus ALCF2SS1-6 TaxID=1328759 RepID=A0A5C2SU27_9APHY|nr:hypothetical protein L227DRAFT_649307 [Lentinus tigrinus ALCF2SS1-6]